MITVVRAHRQPPDPATISDVYIDESSQTNHRYLVIGGLIVPALSAAAANTEIARLRLPELPHGELKWNRVSNAKLPAYQRQADSFFDRLAFRDAHFHSLVVDTTGIDNAMYNKGSRDIGFNKEVYQLAIKFARLYSKRIFHVYPDHRETTQRTDDLRNMLNFGRRKAGDTRDWPYRRCHFRDSKATPLLQFVDILTGAIAYRLNGHGLLPGASPSKIALSDHILKRAGIADAFADTSMSGKFTIWHRKLQPRSRGVPRA